MAETLFTRIIKGEIKGDFVHEDDLCVAFRDVNPQAPVHILIVPRKPIPKIADAATADQTLLGHLMLVAGKVARELKIEEGFRLVINNGESAGQTVFHLHVHLLAGRAMGWPPG